MGKKFEDHTETLKKSVGMSFVEEDLVIDVKFLNKTGVEPERYGNSVYFPITNKYLLILDDVLSSNTILEYA